MIRVLNLLGSSLAICLIFCPAPLSASPPEAPPDWEFPPALLAFDEKQYEQDLSQIHDSVPVPPSPKPATALWSILGQNEARGHLHLGIFYFSEGKIALAEEEFLESIQHDPENALAHFNLGLVLNKLKDWEGAHNAYNEAIRLDPELNIAHTNLGTLNLTRKKYLEATENFTTAVQLDPKDLKARLSLGHLYFYVFKNYPAAKKEYKKVLELDSRVKMAKANLKTILKEEKQAREAQRKFEKSLKKPLPDKTESSGETGEPVEDEAVEESPETGKDAKGLFQF